QGGDGRAAQPFCLCRFDDLLARYRIEFNRCFLLLAGVAIAHDHLEIRASFREGLQRIRKNSRLVLDFLSPQRDSFDFHSHFDPPIQTLSGGILSLREGGFGKVVTLFVREKNGMKLHVQCYSGSKADERPTRFRLDDREYFVEEILDQWYGPEHIFFK